MDGTVRTCSYSKGSYDYFIIGGNDFLDIFNATNKVNTRIERLPMTSEIITSDFSDDGKVFAIASNSKQLQVYHLICTPPGSECRSS